MSHSHSLAVSFTLFLTIWCENEVQAQSKADFSTIPQSFAKDSPSGGPAKHRNAAVCIVYRKSAKFAWLEGDTVQTCILKMTAEKDDTKFGGPIPVGEFLIGQRYRHAKHKIDWYKLYPRKEDDSGYYPYAKKTKTGRYAMGLHPGRTSLGCATIQSITTPYDKDACWKKLRQYLDKCKLTYKGSQYTGFLYVVNK